MPTSKIEIENERKRDREQAAADAREQIERRLGDGGGCAELAEALSALREQRGETGD